MSIALSLHPISRMPRSTSATVALTTLALLAFAANSLFCRLALHHGAIDAASFTLLRLFSGAVVLTGLHLARHRGSLTGFAWNGVSATALFVYAAAFSLAYRDLPAGTGALLLFGAVQATMLGFGLVRGERPTTAEWLGLGAALGGLVYLVAPGLSAPPFAGSALMLLAGAAWGLYSLRGRSQGDPLATTAANFICAVPLGGVFCLAPSAPWTLTAPGAAWAVLSGALASGLGYVIWYSALPGLTATRAATVQLIVPVLAAIGGVAFLHETITVRLIVSALLVLGGIGLAIFGRTRHISRP